MKMISARTVLIIACSIAFLTQTGLAEAQAKAGPESPFPELQISLITESPQIDGTLDEEIWKGPPLPIGEWLSYNPLYGDKIVQSTRVWAAYDQTGLYFAFHCLDPEPEKIKTAIRRRDRIFYDDWIGLSLASLGGHQSV